MVVATHSKLKKATNRTSTQVAICMINKQMAKINGKEIYNIRGPPGIGDRRKRGKKTVVVDHPRKFL